MVAVPAPTPPTTPAPDTVATVDGDALHVPEPGKPVTVVVVPAHIAVAPGVMEVGRLLTVTFTDLEQPVDVCVNTIVPIPALKAVTIPDAFTVVIVGVVVLHVPGVLASASVVEARSQILVVPVIAAGSAFTVTVAVARQLLASVKVMIALPADTPVTIPLLVTVAILVAPDVHVPEPEDSVSVSVPPPAHTVPTPPIGLGLGLSVSVRVA